MLFFNEVSHIRWFITRANFYSDEIIINLSLLDLTKNEKYLDK